MRKSKIRWLCEWVVVIGLGLLLYRFIKKDSLIVAINRSLPYEEAGVLRGMILGDKEGLGRELYEGLKKSGLVHLVVASGANVMLLTRIIIEGLAGFLGRKKTIVLALVMVWGYAGMVEWQAPILRAAILVSVFYWSQILGRRFDVGRGLGLTVVIMLLAWSEWVGEVGFWLSLLAFMGVITRQSRISNFKLQIVDDLMTTVWVGVWVTPVLALVFGQISLIAPITNTMVVFLVEYITIVGSIGVVVGLGWAWVGEKIVWLVLPALKYVVWVAENLGWGAVGIKFNWPMLVGWYLILGWWLARRHEK